MDTWLTTIAKMFVVRFWATPHHSMNGMVALDDVFSERTLQKLKVYDPGFPLDDPPPESPGNPARFPTDVPAPEPHDVPVPEPIDDPPPDPGKEPSPAKRPQRPKQDPKPHPIP